MKIAGIDYSLSSPAITVYNTKDFPKFGFENVKMYNLTTHKKCKLDEKNLNVELFPSYNSQEERYKIISDWVLRCIEGVGFVFLEGYSFGSKGSSVFQIAENMGNLKMELWKNNIEFECLPPREVKKYATGNGNASKGLMEEVFLKNEKIDLRKKLNLTEKQENPISDLIDSFYICKEGVSKKALPSWTPKYFQ